MIRPAEPDAVPAAGPLTIGVTGHIFLAEATLVVVYEALVCQLNQHAGRSIVGVTCLADGADQLFARAVLSVGGQVEVILPAPDYRDEIRQPVGTGRFDDLVARARTVSYTSHGNSGQSAYVAASRAMLSRSDQLLAVWDGAAGATADVVNEAKLLRIPTTVVWPAGARRHASP